MSVIKVKLKQDSWFYSHPGHHSLGGISRCSAWHLPQVFAHYLPLTIDFSCLYRDCMMTEYAFFAGKAERWGKDMMSLWAESQHLPPTELPGTPVSFLWGTTFHQQPKNLGGDIQEPCNDIAYLLVCTGDTLEALNYGISLVWISPNQVWASTMEEVVGTLSTYISSGPN